MKKVTVKMIRIKLGMSQESMAKAVGISLSSYQRKERNEVSFDWVEIVKICEMSGYDPNQIEPQVIKPKE